MIIFHRSLSIVNRRNDAFLGPFLLYSYLEIFLEVWRVIKIFKTSWWCGCAADVCSGPIFIVLHNYMQAHHPFFFKNFPTISKCYFIFLKTLESLCSSSGANALTLLVNHALNVVISLQEALFLHCPHMFANFPTCQTTVSHLPRFITDFFILYIARFVNTTESYFLTLVLLTACFL